MNGNFDNFCQVMHTLRPRYFDVILMFLQDNDVMMPISVRAGK